MLQENLQTIFRQVFEDDTLVINDEMTAKDVEKWDSLSHITLILEVEKFFGIKLKNSEIARLKRVGDLKKLIAKHKPDLA